MSTIHDILAEFREAEHGNPTYIFDLVKHVVRGSVETVRIVKALLALDVLPGRGP